jgi:lysophospholipase L1-like esterase
VSSLHNAGTIVALGDSITDGRGSTLDANRRWPDRLAERLNEHGQALGVVNAGLAGNRILHGLPEMICGPSSLSRFEPLMKSLTFEAVADSIDLKLFANRNSPSDLEWPGHS